MNVLPLAHRVPNMYYRKLVHEDEIITQTDNWPVKSLNEKKCLHVQCYYNSNTHVNREEMIQPCVNNLQHFKTLMIVNDLTSFFCSKKKRNIKHFW